MTHKEKLIALLNEMGVEHEADSPYIYIPGASTQAHTWIEFDEQGQFKQWAAWEA